jgi:hypothetical protein
VEKPHAFECFYGVPFPMNVIPPALRTVYGVVQGVANVLSSDLLL